MIKLELLCDIPGDQFNAVIPLPRCEYASAMNLQGPGAAIADTDRRRLAVPGHLGSGTVEVRFAGLGGFLLSKGAAVSSRGAAKGRRANSCRPPSSDAKAINHFVTGERVGAHAFARETVATADTSDYDQLLEDAASGAFEFWTRLETTELSSKRHQHDE